MSTTRIPNAPSSANAKRPPPPPRKPQRDSSTVRRTVDRLTFVKHGQSAAFCPDADRLTPLGIRQGKRLGRNWVARRLSFDAVYTGTQRCHAQMEDMVAAAYAEAGVTGWPEAKRLPDWNEYQAYGLFDRIAPRLAKNDPMLRKLLGEYRQHTRDWDRNRYYLPVLQHVMTRWADGTIEHDEDLESLRWSGPDMAVLSALADELGQPRLVERAPTP